VKRSPGEQGFAGNASGNADDAACGTQVVTDSAVDFDRTGGKNRVAADGMVYPDAAGYGDQVAVDRSPGLHLGAGQIDIAVRRVSILRGCCRPRRHRAQRGGEPCQQDAPPEDEVASKTHVGIE